MLKELIIGLVALIFPSVIFYLAACFVKWGIQDIGTWTDDGRGIYLALSVVCGVGLALLAMAAYEDAQPKRRETKEISTTHKSELWKDTGIEESKTLWECADCGTHDWLAVSDAWDVGTSVCSVCGGEDSHRTLMRL